MDFNNGPAVFAIFFVCNIEKLIVWCIAAEKVYYILTKNNRKFQATMLLCATVKGVLLSVRVLEYFSKIP